MLPRTSARAPSISGTAPASISSEQPLAAAISDAWPISPNPVTSVQAWTAPPAKRSSTPAAARFSVVIDRTAASMAACGRAAELQRGRDDAGANRLGQEQRVAGHGPRIRQHARRMDLAGHRVAELDLRVLDRVSAEQRDAGLGQLVETAGEDPLQDGAVGVFRKRGDRQRGERPAAHRVDVAQRVGGGNLPVDERIVDDWREEIDRLHERARLVEPVHTCIVRGPIVDQDPVVVLHGQIAQHLGELTSGELARSTGAGGVVGQTLHFCSVLGSAFLVHGSAFRRFVVRRFEVPRSVDSLAIRTISAIRNE